MNARKYELTCEISPAINELELKELIERIGLFMQESEAKVRKTSEPAKKRLGVRTKKQKEAFLVNFFLEASPDKIEQIDKKLKSEPDILRHIIIVKKYSEETPKRQLRREKRLENFIDRRKTEKSEKERSSKSKKVELQEIDQKIEEILNE